MDNNNLNGHNQNIQIYLYGFSIFVIIIIYLLFSSSFKNNNQVDWEIYKISKEDLKPENYLFSESEQNFKYRDNKKDKHEIIIGIDFGTINSGFAYSYINENSKINYNKKIPTEIILSKDLQNALLYSKTATVTMMNYNQKELNKILYIKSIKSLINSKNKTINDNLCYIYPKNFLLNITNDIKSFFKFFKKDILKEIKISEEQKILWIIAIPSNWDEFQKQLIYKSLTDSGMTNIKMIYESEAASLSVFNDKFVENDYKKKNNIFLLIDMGGSSVSYSANKFTDKKCTINQIFSLVKNDVGYIYILEEIINIFTDIVGEKKINNIKSNKPGDWIKFLKQINIAIENTDKLNENSVFDLINIFDFTKNVEYKYNNNKFLIKFISNTIHLTSNLIGNIILNNVNKIKLYLDEVITTLKTNKVKLNCLILTGGLSQNKFIKNEIKNYAKEIGLSVQVMSSYENVISKGCVIYGLNQNSLLPRKSEITLGIYNFIKNKMELLIKKGDEIKNEISVIKFIKPQLERQKKIQIFIYITNEDIHGVNELKKYFFGRLILFLNKNIENIQLTFKYDIHLSVHAINYDDGKDIETELQFFNEDQLKQFPIID